MHTAVIIPVRNRPGLVREALDSVAAQACPPRTLLVVDDGSTDDTPAAVRAWLGAAKPSPGSEWRLLEGPQRGAGAARQAGFLACDGAEAVAFLDSDDLWPPCFLERATGALASDPGLAGVSADRRFVDMGRGRESVDSLARLPANPPAWLLRHGAGIGSCSLVRATAVRAVGGYPDREATGHDIAFFYGLFAMGGWGHLPGEPVTFRRNHARVVGEHDHIHREVPDLALRWARLYDEAYRNTPGVPVGRRARAEVHRSLAKRWVNAAKSCCRQRRFDEGASCLRRAREYQVVSLQQLSWAIRLQALRLIARRSRS